jgi:diacylglycerol kinase family enzyme
MNQETSTAQTAARDGVLCVVLNAGSGRKDSDERTATLARVFDEAGRQHEFFLIEEPGQISEIAARALARAKQLNGVVVAAGGEGTFNYFGRVNGISQDTGTAARALLRADLEPVQVGSVNGRIFLVNGSVGLYPKLLQDREVYKQQLGRSRLVALVSGLRTLLRESRQLDLTIETGGETRMLRTPTLFVGNNRLQFERIGLEDSAQALDHGKLAAVVIKPIGTLAMLGLALRGALGRLGEAEHLDSFAFRRLTVRPRGHRRIKVATDGEIQWLQTPLVFELTAEPLLLLVPTAEDRVKVE